MKSQAQLDEIIRANKGQAAVEKLIVETPRQQEYLLSDGRVLIIKKGSGKGWIETVSGKLIRRF